MSSGGEGGIILLPLALVAGAAALVAAGGAIVVIGGTRMVMWCGDKLEENYRHAAQSFADAVTARDKLTQQDRQDRRELLLASLRRVTAEQNVQLGDLHAAQVMVDRSEVAAVLRSAAQVLSQDSGIDLAALRAQAALDAHRQKVRALLLSARKNLPSSIIQEVEDALRQDERTLIGAEGHLHSAIAAMEAQNQAEIQERAVVQSLIAEATGLLGAASALSQQPGAQQSPQRTDLQHKAQQALETAREYLSIDLTIARDEAQKSREYALKFADALADDSINVQDQLRRRFAQQLGALQELSRIATETRMDQYITRLHALQTEIIAANARMDSQALGTLTTSITNLKQELFAEMGQRQQRGITTVIHDTLSELGYQLENDELQGELTRIKAVQTTSKQGQGQQTVRFYVDTQGGISYDFSGFQGEGCVLEAQRVFAALRQHGIVIYDRRRAAGVLDATELSLPEYSPTVRVTEQQAYMHATIKRVMQAMGLQAVEERTIVDETTGRRATEIQGSRDGLGLYHISVQEQGGVAISHNGLPPDPQDPLIAKMWQTLQTQETQQQQVDAQLEEQRRAAEAKALQQQMQHQQNQMLAQE